NTMATGQVTLEFRKKELLTAPELAQYHLLDNGVIFYYEPFKQSYPSPKRDPYYEETPRRLYVKWQGVEVEAELPDGNICETTISAVGNALYFEADRKLYKATFAPPITIKIELVRDMLEDEETRGGGLVTRVVEGKTIVYRIDGTKVAQPRGFSELIHGLELRGIHRGKVVYVFPGTVNKLDADVIVAKPNSCFHDSSPFVFTARSEGWLAAQDLITIPAPVPIAIKVISANVNEPIVIQEMLGIANGEIVLIAKRSEDSHWYLMTAHLPGKLTRPQAETAKDRPKMEIEMAWKEQQFQSTIDEQSQRILELQSIIDSDRFFQLIHSFVAENEFFKLYSHIFSDGAEGARTSSYN
ncbi:hypothetical protein PMAYCL1PPCAC_08267, partial [Pristionchus mayeri]